MSQAARDRGLNFWLGAGTLVLVALAALYLALRPVLNAPAEPARKFVAYFENAGGINVNDVVRIKGRRAGRVSEVSVVRREGKTLVRVEFEIAPGSGSQWLKDGAIPADSVVQVKVPAVLGRPSLSVEIGSDGSSLIQEGGEWTRARGVSGQDQFQKLHEQLTSFDAVLDQLVGAISDKELIDNLKAQVGSIRKGLESAEANIAAGFAQSGDYDKQLEEASKALSQLNSDLKARTSEISERLGRIKDQTQNAPQAIADVSEKLSELRGQVEKFSTSIESSASLSEGSELGKVFAEFRRMAATLRASSDRGAANPKEFGNMPPWRLARPYFNGGKTALEAADKAEAAAAVKHVELPMPPKPPPKTSESSSGD